MGTGRQAGKTFKERCHYLSHDKPLVHDPTDALSLRDSALTDATADNWVLVEAPVRSLVQADAETVWKYRSADSLPRIRAQIGQRPTADVDCGGGGVTPRAASVGV